MHKNGIDLTRGWSSSMMTRMFGWVSSWARLFVTFTLINAIDRSDPKIDAIVAEFLNLCSELLQGREEIDNFLWHLAGTILSYVTEVGFALLSSPLWPHGFIQTYVWYEVLVSGSDVFVFHSGSTLSSVPILKGVVRLMCGMRFNQWEWWPVPSTHRAH